jgi:hypothetical protein
VLLPSTVVCCGRVAYAPNRDRAGGFLRERRWTGFTGAVVVLVFFVVEMRDIGSDSFAEGRKP